MALDSGGLSTARHAQQPDLVGPGTCEAQAGQRAQSGEQIRGAFEPGGLGAGRHVPQSDRVVARSRSEPAVGQQAQGSDPICVALEPYGLGAAR
jgi:hypothetical protein